MLNPASLGTANDIESTMIVEADLSEPYWECAKVYVALIYGSTVCPHGKSNELRSSDYLSYGVTMNMQSVVL